MLVKVSSATGFVSLILSGSGTGTALTGVGLPVGVSLATLGGFFWISKFFHWNLIKKDLSKSCQAEENSQSLQR